jgi:hypothetical protein
VNPVTLPQVYQPDSNHGPTEEQVSNNENGKYIVKHVRIKSSSINNKRRYQPFRLNRPFSSSCGRLFHLFYVHLMCFFPAGIEGQTIQCPKEKVQNEKQ